LSTLNIIDKFANELKYHLEYPENPLKSKEKYKRSTS